MAYLGPVREAMLEGRNAVDCFLGSIDAMHQILTDFAECDAGPTRWKVPRVIDIYCCSNRCLSDCSPSLRYYNLEAGSLCSVYVHGRWVQRELLDLLMQQRRWMDGVAWGHFAERTSAVHCSGCGRPVYIPFCGLRHELMNSIDACSTKLSVPLQTPDEIDTYMWEAKRGPWSGDTQHEALIWYATAAIWRDLAPSHVDQHGRQLPHDHGQYWTEWLHKDADRVYLRKLWAMWAVSMKALLKVNIRMRLLVCERHIVGDPQHAILGSVMNDTESVFSILTYEQDGFGPGVYESWFLNNVGPAGRLLALRGCIP